MLFRNMRIRNGFDKFVCLRSNLSNDNIISAQRPGLKTGMDLEDRAAHAHQESPGVPSWVFSIVSCTLWKVTRRTFTNLLLAQQWICIG